MGNYKKYQSFNQGFSQKNCENKDNNLEIGIDALYNQIKLKSPITYWFSYLPMNLWQLEKVSIVNNNKLIWAPYKISHLCVALF